MRTIADRLAFIQDRIDRAAASVGRDAKTVTLVAVSKTVSIPEIKAAYDLGMRHFGESRLQEALPKIAALPSDIVWHFVGRLQSNKARGAAEKFQVIHSLESQAQLKEIGKGERTIDGLIEVNLAQEEQKSGIFAETLDEYRSLVLQCPHVRFRGLMAIGPQTTDTEASRAIFRALASLGRRVGAEWLSLGMSSDFEAAIQEGSTHVRIGSALFGERK